MTPLKRNDETPYTYGRRLAMAGYGWEDISLMAGLYEPTARAIVLDCAAHRAAMKQWRMAS
jgi:hypothetical protein